MHSVPQEFCTCVLAWVITESRLRVARDRDIRDEATQGLLKLCRAEAKAGRKLKREKW